MKIIPLILLQYCFVLSLYSQQYIPLWPSGALPNSKGQQLEHIEERQRITQVSQPGIYAFFTSKDANTQSAVLICPSGGYQKLTYDLAGFQFAKWLNTLGINAFVLIYRLPTSIDLIEREVGPIQDAQRAMKIIRSNSLVWQIDENKIGVMGSSSGGHLATTLGTHFVDYSSIGDSLDTYSFESNFMILISPVITMGEYAHNGSVNNLLGKHPTQEMIDYYSNEQHVSIKTPPTFLVHAQNDHVVHPMNSILYYQAMLKTGVPGSLHIFPEGDHSIALRNNPKSINIWTVLCEEWLHNMEIVDNTKE